MGRSQVELRAIEGLSGGVLAGLQTSSQHARRGTAQVLDAYRTHPWLRAAVDRIAQPIASVPWRVFSAPDRATTRRLSLAGGDMRARGINKALISGDVEEIFDHPLLTLLQTWNPCHTGSVARQIVQSSLDLKGEVFIIKERMGGPGSNTPVSSLWPIPSHWIKETPSETQRRYRGEWRGWQRDIVEADMIWLRHPNPADPYSRGVGLGESLADELDADEMAAKHTSSFLRDRAVPMAIVSALGMKSDEAERLERTWIDKFRGAFRAARVFFTGRDLKVEKLTHSFADMNLTELRHFQRNVVIQAFGLPPETLGIIENSNRATIESSFFLFSRLVMKPRLEFLCNELQSQLVRADFGPDLLLSYENPVPEDQEQRLEVGKVAPWSMTTNEWRELAHLEPIDGGDVFPVSPNLVWRDEHPETLVTPPPVAPVTAAVEAKAATAPVRKVSESDIPNVLEALRPIELDWRIEDREGLLVDFGERAMNEVGVKGSFNLLSPIVVEHIQTHEINSKFVDDTTRSQLSDVIFEGVLEGEAPRDIANRIRAYFGGAIAEGKRADVIARTEVLRASNFARWQGHVQSGIVDERQWLTARDARVRPDKPKVKANHRVLNMQKAKVDRPFVVPPGSHFAGSTAMHPGGFGIKAMDIQCRCTTIAVVEPIEQQDVDAFDAFEAAGRVAVRRGTVGPDATEEELADAGADVVALTQVWDARVRRLIVTGFLRQRDEALEALERAG